ncbi:hypothetical protein WDZ11_22380 (plasmid) [Roseomonas mucosa]|uniref:hypothetical protein n=1 Tax=Roseomonas mucosa TaxID=207340 RepID=UPI0030CD1C9A
MMASNAREQEVREPIREVPVGTWAVGPDGMHIHLHIGDAPVRRRSRSVLLPWLGIAAAVVVAYGLGQFMAPQTGGREVSPVSMRAALPGAAALYPAEVQKRLDVQAPPLPQLPPVLQQQLAQPPRVVPPPAPVLPAAPAVAPRNAFGLDR